MMTRRVVVLCGGVGGAKLVLGLAALGDDVSLLVAVNTGDDFEHLGLHISPDIDTVLYTLAGLSDPVRGWGRKDESWQCMAALAELGGETWFALGDRDLALHLERTRRLAAGESLASIVHDIARRMGLRAQIVPMTGDPVRTVVHTPDGPLPFQRYFVQQRCAPTVTAVSFEGADTARPDPALLDALADRQVHAIVIAPSNPYLSIDPILALPGVRHALERALAPVIAVSPIVGGAAVKGPTAKIMRELGMQVRSQDIAAHYDGLLDGLVIDHVDNAEAAEIGVPVLVTCTLMRDFEDRHRLAQDVLAFAGSLQPSAKSA